MRLSPDRIQFYRDNGYLVVEDVIDPNTLSALRETTNEYIERARWVKQSNPVFDIGPGHDHQHPVVRRIKDPTKQHAVYDQVMRSDAIVDIVESLIGPGVRFDHAKLNFKPKGGDAAVEWHQDWAYYPYTNDDMLAVGVLLEDCDETNGPLQVIPGSHRGPTLDHHHAGFFVGAINLAKEQIDISQAVSLTGKAGSITVHHVRVIHGSADNQSDRDRPLLIFSYVAIDAWPLVDKYDLAEFDSRILRGEPTLTPRQKALPVRLPFPPVPNADSIYDDQRAVRGQSFT